MFVHYLPFTMGLNIVIELPKGHGKSPIIACLVQALSDSDKNIKIIVVTMNNYLTHHAFENYQI